MKAKAERIRDLLEATDLSNQDIAEAVGVLDSYVRVVQQRLISPRSNSMSKADMNWKARNFDRWTEKNRAGARRQRLRRKLAQPAQASA